MCRCLVCEQKRKRIQEIRERMRRYGYRRFERPHKCDCQCAECYRKRKVGAILGF